MEIIKSVFHSKSKRYQFIRYCTVGSLAAGIHYGVYFVLQEYELVNLNIAYTIGYATSFICNFFMTSYLPSAVILLSRKLWDLEEVIL